METTYADLRPDDTIIDKSGNEWGLADVQPNGTTVNFTLVNPTTKIRTHEMTKPLDSKVTVKRIPKHVDTVRQAEQDFPSLNGTGNQTGPGTSNNDALLTFEEVQRALPTTGIPLITTTVEEDEMVRAVITGEPIDLPAFEDMTDLEMRSHLYLLHGIFGHDVPSRDELINLHDEAHYGRSNGTVKANYVAHTHRKADR